MAIKMGFVKRRCQAEEACVTTGRKSTDPVFRYHSVARVGRIDRSVERSPCARRCRRTEAGNLWPYQNRQYTQHHAMA